MKAYLSDDGSHVICFVGDSEDPEYYTVEQFIAIHGEDALPSAASPTELDIVDDYSEYWSAAIELVNAWAKYQGKRNLYINNDDENARHKVGHVIIRYYGGDVGRLVRHEHSLIVQVHRALADFQCQCSKYNVNPVNIMWLGLHLLEGKHYKSLREKCQRRKKSGKTPVSLRELI